MKIEDFSSSVDVLLSDAYCASCDSTAGYDRERPDFCIVCWDARTRLPHKIRRVLLAVQVGQRYEVS